MSPYLARVQLVVFEKFYKCLFIPNCTRKITCDKLLIINMKKFDMVKQKKRTHITQSKKNCAINCASQGVCLIWKQKIWLALTKPYRLLANHNPEFRCVILHLNCTALNQSQSSIFFMYIINNVTVCSETHFASVKFINFKWDLPRENVHR